MSEKSLKISPNLSSYLDTYGWILFLNGEYSQAEEYLKKALDQRKWDADILEHYGDCLFKLGKIDEAVIHWEKAKKKGSISTTLDRKIKDRKLNE